MGISESVCVNNQSCYWKNNVDRCKIKEVEELESTGELELCYGDNGSDGCSDLDKVTCENDPRCYSRKKETVGTIVP